MAGFGSIFGRLSSLFTAGAVGGAAADSVAPVLRLVEQHANERRAVRVVDPGTAADAAAQLLNTDLPFRSLGEDGAVIAGSVWQGSPVDFEDDAKRGAVGHERFRLLRGLRMRVPPYPEALVLWRRGRIDEATIDSVLAREGIPKGLWPALKELAGERLDPAIIATAIQRGIMSAPFKLPYNVDVPVGHVTPFPVSTLDAEKEAKAAGIDVERLRVATALVGLPMALDRAAQAHFRGILTNGDYLRAVLEGNARGEWADAELEVARQILTASQYAELQLRGFYDEKERHANTAKHGMTIADSDLLYNVLGRSVNVHAVTTGLARGGKYPSVYADVPQPYRAAIQRSNIREEWVGLAYANRYSLPSVFAMRALTQTHVWSEAKAALRLREAGWIPEDADEAAKAWHGGTGAKGDPHVVKAQNQLWTTVHSSYIVGDTDAATATTTLGTLGVDPTAIPQVITLWDAEKALTRKELTPKQLKDAYAGGIINPATGTPYTKDEVTSELVLRGFSPADATTFLEL